MGYGLCGNGWNGRGKDYSMRNGRITIFLGAWDSSVFIPKFYIANTHIYYSFTHAFHLL